MRDNLIRHCSQYDLEHLLGFFCCTFRVRGFFGTEFISRTNDGEPHAKEEFIRHIMDPSSWCLLERFWIEFPDLVKGLDPSLMLRQDSLTFGL